MHRLWNVFLVGGLVALGCDERPLQALRPTPSRPGPGHAQGPGGDAGVAPAPSADPCAVLPPEQRDAVVARVGDVRLTLCDFTRRINTQNPYLRARFNAPEQRHALLRSWVDAELLAAEAHARHLDEEPSVRRAVTLQLARRLEQELRAGVTQPEVSDADVRAYYEAHRDEYHTEAQVRASQLVVATRAEAERLLADLRLHEADDGYFRAAVRRSSVDPASRAADGDLAFFGRAGGPGVEPEVAAAAFALTRAGQFADHVVESAHGGPNRGPGFHLVRLTTRRDAMDRTLEEESHRIRNHLLRERLDQAEEAAVSGLVAQLRQRSNVQIDEAALAAVRVEASPPPGPPPTGRPPRVPPTRLAP